MAGLLDGMFGGSPGQQGLLAGSMALMNAGGPSRMPVSLGQALGQGFGAGQQAYQQAMKQKQDEQEFALQKQYRDAQMQEMKARADEAQQQRSDRDWMRQTAQKYVITPQPATGGMGQFNSALPPEMQVPATGAMPSVPGGFDAEGFLSAMSGRDPLAAAKMRKELLPEDSLMTVAPGATVYDKSNQKTLYTAPDRPQKPEKVDPNKPFLTVDGKVVPNKAYQDYEIAKAKAGKSTSSGGSPDIAIAMSPEAITNAAARYNVDGTLPPMGMGKAGAVIRANILNEAAKLAALQPGDTPEQQRIRQIANKASSSALTQLKKQAANVGAFERNFQKNADIVLEYSNQVDRTGVPIINKWINVGKRAVVGDPTLAGFDQAIKSAVNEYTKIISGSMGNTQVALGEIKKVESLLSAAQNVEQVREVIGLMKRETGNRLAGFAEEEKSLTDSMRSVPAKATEKTAVPFNIDPSALDAEIAKRRSLK